MRGGRRYSIIERKVVLMPFLHSLVIIVCVALAIFSVVSLLTTTFLFRGNIDAHFTIKRVFESDSFLTLLSSRFLHLSHDKEKSKKILFIALIKRGMVPWNWLAWSRDVWKRAFIINALKLTKCVHLSLKYAESMHHCKRSRRKSNWLSKKCGREDWKGLWCEKCWEVWVEDWNFFEISVEFCKGIYWISLVKLFTIFPQFFIKFQPKFPRKFHSKVHSTISQHQVRIKQ